MQSSPSDENIGLNDLFRRAIKEGILPDADKHRVAELIKMRNKLAHGHLEIHTPKMALQLLSRYAEIIDQLFLVGGAIGARSPVR